MPFMKSISCLQYAVHDRLLLPGKSEGQDKLYSCGRGGWDATASLGHPWPPWATPGLLGPAPATGQPYWHQPAVLSPLCFCGLSWGQLGACSWKGGNYSSPLHVRLLTLPHFWFLVSLCESRGYHHATSLCELCWAACLGIPVWQLCGDRLEKSWTWVIKVYNEGKARWIKRGLLVCDNIFWSRTPSYGTWPTQL